MTGSDHVILCCGQGNWGFASEFADDLAYEGLSHC